MSELDSKGIYCNLYIFVIENTDATMSQIPPARCTQIRALRGTEHA